MRFTSIVLTAGLALFANAATPATSVAATTTYDAVQASQSAVQEAILRCLKACKAGDVNCQAKCIAVPSPDDSQVNDTTKCVANCPKGKGTEADNNKYSQCVQDCIGQHYFTGSAGAPPQATSTAGSGSGSGSGSSSGSGDASSTGGAGSGSGSGSGNSDSTGSAGNGNGPTGTSGNGASQTTGNAAASSTGAASLVGVSSGVAGVFGFIAAVLAL
ncbi:uncharacterized protein C8A04DRAFT_39593 [Dichotomopilus funicola]|uniref:HFB protein n=1 Tax=Dichotomopilus funicola TaxID=1934379 RepID=A0AAN6UXX9_9PEZI|nr:hypothetical protein C8A04DRAFT_39593 [Dichotomopilus funicola]